MTRMLVGMFLVCLVLGKVLSGINERVVAAIEQKDEAVVELVKNDSRL